MKLHISKYMFVSLVWYREQSFEHEHMRIQGIGLKRSFCKLKYFWHNVFTLVYVLYRKNIIYVGKYKARPV